MHNPTGIMLALKKLVRAHQEPVTENIHEATLQLADAVIGSAGVTALMEYCEEVMPAGPHLDAQEPNKVRLRAGVTWERVWAELEKM